MNETPHIVIAGAGPAGAMVALGLARLSYRVSVIHKPRGFDACEGISERVVQAFLSQGAHHALSTINEPSPRSVLWNNENSAANTERLIARQALDQALLQDLRDAGVTLLEGQLLNYQLGKHGAELEIQTRERTTQNIPASFFVDARGRSASTKGDSRLKGPETLSLLLHWRGGEHNAASRALSFDSGWAWLARLNNGRCYTQITLSPQDTDLPPRAKLRDFVLAQLNHLPGFKDFIGDAQVDGEITARSATAILSCDPIGKHWIRVGDAAMAVDPLSGNGIFQSLSSALCAPAVIHTLLTKPQQTQLAQEFYCQRINHNFMRFARMGRDFYQMEQRWLDSPFWQQRRVWPDTQPAHEPVVQESVTVATRPVIHNQLIEAKQVVSTPDQPMGIWHMDGIELAPLVQSLQQTPLRSSETLEQRFGYDVGRHGALQQWLQQLQLL